MSRLRFAVVLPARFASTRFPGKPLARIAGRPLIEWVYRRAREIEGAGALVVATDDRRIAEVVEGFGGRVVMTSPELATGTDRVAAVAEGLDFDVFVNLQGDEPVFDPATVEAMVDMLAEAPELDITTACHAIADEGELRNPNVVKVVTDLDGRALYFSRSPIPSGALDGSNDGVAAWRHVGVYAYRREALKRFTTLPRTRLERSERLEQLRALEHGMKIGVVVTSQATLGVDVPEDIKTVEKVIGSIYTD